MKSEHLVDWFSQPILGLPEATRLAFLDRALLRVVGADAGCQISESSSETSAFKRNKELSDRLTPRQRQVLWHLAQGKLKKEIASDMNLSVSTVDNYCAAIYKVLGVHNKVEATRIVFFLHLD